MLPGNLVCCENDWDYHDKRFPPPFVPGTSFALGNVCVSEKGLAVISLQIVLLKEPLLFPAPCAVRGSARMHRYCWILWRWFLPQQWFSLGLFWDKIGCEYPTEAAKCKGKLCPLCRYGVVSLLLSVTWFSMCGSLMAPHCCECHYRQSTKATGVHRTLHCRYFIKLPNEWRARMYLGTANGSINFEDIPLSGC